MKKKLFAIFLLLLVLLVSALGCTQQIPEDSNNPQTVTGRVVTNIEEPPDSPEADYNICNNAQTYGICYKLDAAFKDGYKEACCKSHKLCC